MQDDIAPTQKFGYVDVKQPAKVKGRKLKSWRRRWAVLTLLNDLSRGGKPLAKLDLFENEAKWNRDSSDRVTFVLENVTSIRDAQSRTHPHAMEIVQRHAVLVLSGASEVDSYSWKLALQQMLVPSQVEKYENTFLVSILPNGDAGRCGLCGDHVMYVTPQHIELVNPSGVSTINWGLSTLVRFNQEGNSVIIIQCGPNSPTGESTFRLSCLKAEEALRSIRQCICQALLRKQNSRQQQQMVAPVCNSLNATTAESLSRHRTISATISEKGFQGLLDNTALALRLDRSDSDSSEASMPSLHHFVAPVPLSPVSLTFPTSEKVGAFHGGSYLGFDEEFIGKDLSGNASAAALVRNNSHSSVGSISPVVLRQSNNSIDISQHGFMLDLNGVSATINGSPTNRSKRSSDSICISTTELEAVPERDENIERASPDPFRLAHDSHGVSFGLGTSSLPVCSEGISTLSQNFEGFSQHTGIHRRYSSLPVADSGYSVIKDVSSSTVKRERASTVSDSGCCNIDTPTFIPQQNTQEKSVHINKYIESAYHQIEAKKENPYSTIGGRSGRRRSSSLSDLQTAKFVSKSPHFENVYEDVDELRETMKKLREMSLTDCPPELPARPPSVSFSTSSVQASPGSKPRADTVGGLVTKNAKKKRFLFGKKLHSSSLDTQNNDPSLNNAADSTLPTKICACNTLNSDAASLATDLLTSCTVCERPTPNTSFNFSQAGSTFKFNMSRTISSSTEELIHASDSSSFSELYADIIEIRCAQGKRRRSSDITPVKHLLDMDIITKISDRVRINEQKNLDQSTNNRASSLGQTQTSVSVDEQNPPALPQRRHSPPSKTISTGGLDLIQLMDDIENASEKKDGPQNNVPTASRTASPRVSPHQPPPASDPLISFFLDDNMFQENPMVTGIMPPSKPLMLPQTFASNTKDFPYSTNGLPSSTTNLFSTSFSMGDLRDNNNNSSNSSSPAPAWSTNLSYTRSEMSPLNFSNPFTEDLLLWTVAETSVKGEVQSPVKVAVEGNYLAMTTLQGAGQGRGQENIYMMPSGN